jgi:hypothetical protein
MAATQNTAELQRLIEAFTDVAAKLPDIRFTRFFIMQGEPPSRRFATKNHVISLWQFYGMLGPNDHDQFVADLQNSDPTWGIPGAELSAFAVIEGDACELFVRMAKRAGSLFDNDEANTINRRMLDRIYEKRLPTEGRKPVALANPNPLALWLNYLLYHLSLTNPGREKSETIDPDPFSLSLSALERLARDAAHSGSDQATRPLADIAFQVGLSFPGEKRAYVKTVASSLNETLGPDAVFYDFDYQAQLARPNLDTYLQNIYARQCRLIVVFLCADYAAKEWCGLEWRVVRELIKSRKDDRVMYVRLDHAQVDGAFSIDGYIDGTTHSPSAVASLIETRLRAMPQ